MATNGNPTAPDRMLDDLLSPELALVDPELALVARATLPEPGWFRPEYLTRGPAPPTAPASVAPLRPPAAAVAAVPLARVRARRPHRRRLVVAGVAAVVAAAAGASLLATTPTMRTESPSAGRSVDGSRTNTWQPVAGARAYDIALARNGAIVYRTTTPNTTLTLPADLHLTPGRYTWTVSLPPDKPGAIQPSRTLVVTTFEVPSEA